MRSDVSINRLVDPLVRKLVTQAENLRIGVRWTEDEVCIIDGGIDAVGGIEAGRQIAEICMGGLGQATLTFRAYKQLVAAHHSCAHATSGAGMPGKPVCRMESG